MLFMYTYLKKFALFDIDALYLLQQDAEISIIRRIKEMKTYA